MYSLGLLHFISVCCGRRFYKDAWRKIAITLIDRANVRRAEENGGLAHDPILGKTLGTLPNGFHR
jgi:hypothetical protein